MPSEKDIVEQARRILGEASRIHALNDKEPSRDEDVSWLMEALADEVERLRELVVHMHVHSGYPDNGYMQMMAPQKALYDAVWQRSVEELDAEEASHHA